MCRTMLFAAIAMFFLAGQALADSYMNYANPEAMQGLKNVDPGTRLYLPDGQTVIIEEILRDGSLKTEDGLLISPEGIIQTGPQAGVGVYLTPELAARAEPGVAIDPVMERKESVATPAPGQQKPKKPEASTVKPKAKTPTPVKEAPKTAVAPDSPPESAKPGHTLTLAELLPLTQVKEKKPGKEETKKEQPKKEQAKKEPEPKQKKQPDKQKKQPDKQKAEPAKPAAQAPKAGQPMRIPPEAIKSGNLDFLEGCWQGTRPEYTTKRTVRECFCFSKGGKTGKRRIFDSIGHRECIGASRANLSQSGVLSVTSQTMVCSDGEKWGAARMQCRNSGPRTPCSWIFMDANNGSQAYEIPFIRVESCRR